jgi:hypothetical protein
MNLNVQNIIANLDSISSVENPNELQKLDASVQQLLASEKPELGIDALLRVFERFPNKDGFGIFWSILSGLERLPDYEEKLIESIRRQPSEFSLLMVNRMLNAGITEVKGVKLLSLMKDVVTDSQQLEEIRAEAQGYVERQQAKNKRT